MSGWTERAFCPCGWSDEPSFGDVWFSQQHYPCCPRCGGSKYGYEMHTVRYVGEQVGTYKLFGIFERPKIEWHWETPEGGRLLFGEELKVLTPSSLALSPNPTGGE